MFSHLPVWSATLQSLVITFAINKQLVLCIPPKNLNNIKNMHWLELMPAQDTNIHTYSTYIQYMHTVSAVNIHKHFFPT